MKKIVLIILLALILALFIDLCVSYGHQIYLEELKTQDYLKWLGALK